MEKRLTARASFRIHPQARQSKITGMLGDAYKLDIAAPARDGEANHECVRYLSDLIHIPRCQIRILTGLSSRRKLIEFDGIAAEGLKRKLDAVL